MKLIRVTFAGVVAASLVLVGVECGIRKAAYATELVALTAFLYAVGLAAIRGARDDSTQQP